MAQPMAESFPSLHLMRHSLAEHKLTYMRDAECSTSRFRQLVREIGMMLTVEVTRDFPLALVKLKTDNVSEEIGGSVLSGNNAVVVPILRAGLILADGALEIMPGAKIGHVGLYRDPKTYDVEEYLVSLPNPQGRIFILMDTVIGTGNSACKAISILKDEQIGIIDANIRFASILVAPEGMRKLSKEHPAVRVYALSLEDGLDKGNRIMPGFGNASARLFGTVD